VVSKALPIPMARFLSTPTCFCLRNRNAEQELQDITPKQFLQLYSVATYTTARTVGRSSILEFDTHIDRLAKLSERAPAIHVSGERMKELVLPTLRQALSAFMARYPEREKDEMRIYFLAAPSPESGAGEQGSGVDILVYVEPLPTKPLGGCVSAALRPVPRRSDPHVKDVQWNMARKVYEALKADDEEEVIMYDEDGMVTEGLSSNAFVLMGDTIFTAPTDVVLPGTFRSLVLDVCKENKIAVSAECPQVSLIDRWQSVFITSTTRSVMPVGTLRFYQRDTAKSLMSSPQVIHFEKMPVLTRLETLVREKMKERATLILE